MITVFGKEWFVKYNKQLCWLANSFVGQFVFKFKKFGHCLDPNKKITKITPNSVAQYNGLVYKEKTGEKITYKIIKEVECHNDKCEYCNFHEAEYGEYPDDCKDAECIKGHTIKKTRIKIVTPIYTKLKIPKEEYTEQFFSRNEYALRLQKIFYPIWLLFHSWDMLIANKFKPAWNLGFDTLTVYPDAGSGSTTVDGQVKRALVDEAWATIVAGAGTHVNTTAASDSIFYIRASTTSNQWAQLFRSIYTFDTSALTVDATISAVVMSLYGTGKADALSITPNINVYTSTPASDNVLIAADYTQVGSTAQCDTVITYAGWNTAGYNDFTFNATGRGNVSKTSISKFGARNVNYDVNNSAPNWTSNLSAQLYAYFADQGSNKPKLVVTYTVGTDYFKTCSEAITINDTLLNKTSRVFYEALSIIDTVAVQKTLKRTLSETITIVDNIDAKKIATKTFSEIISIVDTIKMNTSKVFSETISIVDNLSIQKVLKRTLSETISIVDSIEKSIIKFKTLVENISIVDSMTKKTSRVFTETVTIVDTLSKQLIKIKIFSEAITITDSISKKIGKTFTETISIISSFAAQTYKVARATIKYTGQVLSKLNNTEQIKAKIKKIINN